METKALVVQDVNTVGLGSITIPEPGAGDVLIRVTHSGISPGTEFRKMSGVEGDGFPYIPGYSCVGIVESAGKDVTIPVGTTVVGSGSRSASIKSMWGAHAAYVVRSAESMVLLPNGVTPASAAIARLAAIAFHGLKMARPLCDETVLIVGLGPIGQCAARLYAASGCQVIAVARSAERAEIAGSAAGVEAFILEGDLPEMVNRLVPGGVDIVVDCTGIPSVLPEAIRCGKQPTWGIAPHYGPRIVVQGSYPDVFTVPYTESFIREVQILIPREVGRPDLVTALDLMARGKIDLEPLVSTIRSPQEAQATYDELREVKGSFLTAVFDWNKI